MTPRSLLVLGTLLAAGYNAGTMWMTQVNWSLWRYVGRAEFPFLHRAWWHTIQPIVFPLGIGATLGSLAQVRWRPSGVSPWLVWSSVVLWALSWGSTALWWGRFQGRLDSVRLEDDTLNPLYTRLLGTHWLRVGLITAIAVVQMGIATAHTSHQEAPAEGRCGPGLLTRR